MYRLEREEFLQGSFIALWATLGFQAGFINSFGFLSSGRFVSHVTGFGTQVGLALGKGDLAFAIEMFSLPLFFILGAFLSGVLTSARLEKGLRPRYDLVTLFLPIAVLVLMVAGHLGLFGVFGEELSNFRDFVLLFALSFACGVQNGCFATMTKGQIRTTHLTGISTDIGTDLARSLFGKPTPQEARLIRLTNWTRVATFAFFGLGGVVSILISPHLQFLSLMVPLATSMIVFFSVRKVSVYLDRVWGAPKVSSARVASPSLSQQVTQ
jgi:uncharacterized membrane protein YoaK (UPF0700 family)